MGWKNASLKVTRKKLLKGVCVYLQTVELTTDNMEIRAEKLAMKCFIHDWTHSYTIYLI